MPWKKKKNNWHETSKKVPLQPSSNADMKDWVQSQEATAKAFPLSSALVNAALNSSSVLDLTCPNMDW